MQSNAFFFNRRGIRIFFFAWLAVLSALTALPNLAHGQTHLWSKGLGGINNDFVNQVAVDGGGNAVVTGAFSGTVDFGGGSLTSAGGTDIFVAKFSGADGSHLWSKRFGGADDDAGYGVAIGIGGDVVVTGSFTGTVDFGGGRLGTGLSSSYGFLAKFDATDGSHVWSEDIGKDSYGYSVAVDSRGDVVVTGGVVSVQRGVVVGGGILLAKYSGVNGAQRWSKLIGAAFVDQGNGVAVDSSGNVLVTGSFFQTTVSLGGNVYGYIYDIFVAKYSGADGSLLWSKRFGSTGDDRGLGVAVDSSGNVVVTGFFSGTVDSGGGGLTSAGGRDIFVAKFAGDNGFYLWATRFGGTGEDVGSGVAVDSSGNVVVTGSFQNTVDFGGGGLTSAGQDDIFLAKFTGSNGSHLWSKRFGSIGPDGGRGVAVDGGGNVVVTGSFQGGVVDFGGGRLPSGGLSDIFLAKLAGGATAGGCTYSILPASQSFSANGGTGSLSVTAGSNCAWSAVSEANWITLTSGIGGSGSGNVAYSVAANAATASRTATLTIAGQTFTVTQAGTTAPSQPMQAGEPIWSKGYGGVAEDMALDSQGNVVVTGALTPAGLTDIFVFVAKYSGADGSQLWSKGFVGTGYDRGLGVAVDTNRDVVVTGYRKGESSFDISLAKYSGADGSQLWSPTFGRLGFDPHAGLGVAVDSSGNVIVTGYFRGGVNLGGVELTSAGAADIFVAKFSGAKGSILWAKRFGSVGDDYGSGIAVDSSGNVVVTGLFSGTVNFGGGALTSVGGTDIFVAKFSGADGSPLWSKSFGSTGADEGLKVAVDSNGNVVMTGFFGMVSGRTVDFLGGGLTSVGNADIFMAKLSRSDGSQLWSKRFGSTNFAQGLGVAVDSSGNIVLTGTFQGTADFGGGGLTSVGNYDIFVAKFSGADGSHLWSKRFGGALRDSGSGVAVDSSGNVVVAGTYQGGTVDFGGGALPDTGQIFLAKLLGTSVGAPPAVGTPPAVSDGGVVNNGSFAPGTAPVAPGSIAAVFGTNLNSGSNVLFSSFGADGKLATSLGGASVTINNIAAPMFYSTPGQLGIQIPFEMAGQTSATIQVTVGGQTSPSRTIFLEASAPGIFTLSQDGKGAAAVLHGDGVTAVTAPSPARPGEIIVLYATGLGPLTPPLATGAPSTGNQTVTTPTVAIDGIPGEVVFSGAAPGFVGLNQVNVRIPASTRSAPDIPVVLSIGGKLSNAVTIAVSP